VDRYRKHVTQRFITRREAEIPNLLGKKFIVSVKVDGAFSGYYFNAKNNESFFFNLPAHRIFIGLPVGNDLRHILEEQQISEALIVGELHVPTHEPKDFEGPSSLHALMRVRRNPQSKKDLERVGFKIFDVLQIDGDDWMEKPFTDRFAKMETMFPKTGRVSLVTSKVVTNAYKIQDIYRKYVIDQGHEGLIVHVGNVGYKIKPIHIIDVAIIGMANGRDDTEIGKEQVASCLVALRYPDGNYQILTRVGGGLSDGERTWLWNSTTTAKTDGFSYPTNDRRIYSMVTPRIVGQIEYFDIFTDHEGDPIMEPSLRFDEESNSWELLRMMPFVHLRSPHFIEGMPFREDKSAQTIEDVRIQQVLDVIPLSRIDTVSQIKLNPSKLLAREVYSREDIAVKKFLAWQTNKEDTGLYPRYVVYFLDYSSNRKDPLYRTAKITNDKTQLRDLLKQWIHDEMIGTSGSLKRGWKQVSLFSKLN
jgi:hypothetical protein